MKIVTVENFNTKEEWDENWKNRVLNKGFRNITITGEGNGDLHIYEIEDLKYIRDNCSILEVGCGDGFFLKYVKDHFKNIDELGVDISSFGVNYAKETYGIKAQTIRNLEIFTDKKFDIVICHQVIEHTDNPEEFFDYLCNFVKDDGQIDVSSVTEAFNYDRFHTCCFDELDFKKMFGEKFENVIVKIFDVPSRPDSQILGVGNIKKK